MNDEDTEARQFLRDLELNGQFTESANLEKAIKENLGGLGFSFTPPPSSTSEL